MLGNDIVDLDFTAAESNWRRKGFLNKIFSPEEQRIIRNSGNPDVDVWLLWAMKESAYKAHQRKFNLPRKFNPKDFRCKINLIRGSSVSGEVAIGNHIYHANSSVEKKYIYCYACSEKKPLINQKIFLDSENIKKELISTFSNVYKLPQEKVSIKKDNQFIPYISYENQEIICNFSLTHNGKFSAYIFELRNI